MKKIVSLILCVAMLLTMAAVPAMADAAAYTATVPGRNGDLTVEVTIDNGAIVSVNVTEHVETAGIADPALEQIPQLIVDHQTLAVDAISGATITSEAIVAAVTECVKQAGIDPETMMSAVVTEAAEVTDLTTDVLVVGTGIAGMTAANAACDNGAKVIMIDKMPITGGTSRIAGGYVISVGSKYTAEGAINTAEDMLAYWKSIADQGRDTGYPDYDRVASIWNTNDESIENLRTLGVPLGDQAFAGAYALMHSEGNGAGMMDALEKTSREKGIEILLNCKAEELICDGDAVVGVRATMDGQSFEIRAKSVVLATGGYSKNPELVARYAPELSYTISTAAVSSTGDGILMAEAVGAATFDNYWFSICPMQVGEEFYLKGGYALTNGDHLGVNAEGVRFAAESDVNYSYESTYKTILDGKNPHYYLFDSANADLLPVLEAGIELGEVVKGETLAEVAAAAGVDEAAFTATCERYAELVKAGEDTDFGKPAAMLVAAEQAPYYLVKFYPAAWGSMGGVKTDLETAAVLRSDGSAISGLYAAGETSNRDFYNEVYYGAASLTIYANMGRRAGIAAAANAAE